MIGVHRAWQELTVALVGIGSVQPSPLLQRSGNAIDPAQQAELKELGAVGDVCLRFFDRNGELLDSPFNDRILGIGSATLKSVPAASARPGAPTSSKPSTRPFRAAGSTP